MNNPPNDTPNNTAPAPAPATLARIPQSPLAQTPGFAMALEPTDFDKAWQLADVMAQIKFCNVSNTGEAMARIMYGRILGMAAMQALANVFVIDNKPAIDATAMLGLCLQHPEICEYFEQVSSSAESATWRGRRRGAKNETVITFTLEDARRAKLLDRGEKADMNNWNRYPEDMCNARAIARVARRVFPDLIRGFATTEELRDSERLKRLGIVDAEVIETTTNAEGAPPAVAAQHAGRDFGKEIVDFKARVLAAKTPAEFGALRDELPRFEGTPIHADAKAAYNDAVKAAKKAAKAASEPGEGEKKEGSS